MNGKTARLIRRITANTKGHEGRSGQYKRSLQRTWRLLPGWGRGLLRKAWQEPLAARMVPTDAAREVGATNPLKLRYPEYMKRSRPCPGCPTPASCYGGTHCAGFVGVREKRRTDRLARAEATALGGTR